MEWVEFINVQFQRRISTISRQRRPAGWRQVQLCAIGFNKLTVYMWSSGNYLKIQISSFSGKIRRYVILARVLNGRANCCWVEMSFRPWSHSSQLNSPLPLAHFNNIWGLWAPSSHSTWAGRPGLGTPGLLSHACLMLIEGGQDWWPHRRMGTVVWAE